MEIWKIIKETNNRYEISNLGNVRCENKLVKCKPMKSGYVRVSIKMDTGYTERFFLHKLVATYFIENPENKKEVNHIDGIKNNNIVSNLEWVTPKENQRHRIEVLKKDCKGKNNPMYGMSGEKAPNFKGYIYQVDKQTNTIVGIHAGSGEASKVVGCRACDIIKVLDLPKRSCKGYRWFRDDERIQNLVNSGKLPEIGTILSQA